MMDDDVTRARARRRVWRWVLALWLAPLLLVAGAFLWSAHRERSWRPPTVAESLPNPNGYDVLVAAAKQIGGTADEPARADAALLAAVDRALATPIVVPAAHRDDLHGPLQRLYRSLWMDAAVCVRSGDKGGAVAADWRRIRLGLALCRGRSLRAARTGLQDAAVAATNLAEAVGALDSTAANAYAARLEALLGAAPSPKTIMAQCSPVQSALALTGQTFRGQVAYLVYPAPAARYDQRLAWLRALCAEMDKPMTAWREPDEPSADPTAAPFVWHHLSAAKEMVAHRATLRTALAGMAATAYRKEQGRWPAKLTDLAPRYLKAVPVDPCDGQPLRYRVQDGQARCWSVGVDGRDDGGQSVDPFAPPDVAVGDVVWPAQRRQSEG